MFLRLLIEYLVFGIICFLTISLLIPKMVHTHTVKKEAAAIAQAADKDRMFTQTWAVKESYLKLLGTGMHRPLSSFDAKCDNGCFSIDGAPECLVSIMELGDYTVAVSALTAELPKFIEVRL